MKKRDSSLDCTAGILIIYMISIHIFQWSGMNNMLSSCWMQPLSFFMFWFFFKSGMFYKERKCKEILLGRGGKKLMIPFIVFSLVGHLLQCVKMYMEGDTNWVHYILSPIKQVVLSGSVGGNLPLWFLPSLLAVQLMYTLLHKYVKDEWILLLSVAVAYALHAIDVSKPLYIGNVSLGLAVFSFGHMMRELQYKRLVFVICGIVYLLLLILSVGSIDFRANGVGNESYMLPVLFSLCGCIVINNLFRKCQWRIWILKYVGERAMSFYVLHWLVLLACRIVLSLCGTNDRMTFLWVSILSCCVVLPIVTESLMKSQYRFVLGLR